MSEINIKNVSFNFDGQKNLFNSINVILDTKWKLGLIGRNGRGKTTFLNLLMGKYKYNGKINVSAKMQYFPQSISDATLLTIDIINEYIEKNSLWKVKKELTLLNIDIEDVLWRPFNTLSGGEQTKVLLALLFVDDYSFALIDEPTNHLDMDSRAQVANYLKRKSGFIVVSHDQTFIDQVIDHILVIEKTQLNIYHGDYSLYKKEKKFKDNYEINKNNNLKKEISRLSKTAQKKKEWSHNHEKDKSGSPYIKNSGSVFDKGGIGARSARLMKKSINLQKRMQKEIDNKKALLKDVETTDQLFMNYVPSHHKNLLSIDNLSLGFSNKPFFKPISFTMKSHEILAVDGPNGIGKTTLLKYLFDNLSCSYVDGHIIKSNDLSLSIVNQEVYKIHGSIEEYVKNNKLNREQFLNNLHKLGVERDLFRNKLENMSMGQKKRIVLAKSLSMPAELYIWDEPLNYLDIFNREQLIDLLKDVKPAMLIVEHDKDFIKSIDAEIVHLVHSEKM